ncbi:(2Fe-2S)-binding protein [Aeromonas sp. sif2433]|uniref:(2Fe-2S)-binding protein n=1 Tax=Aeromonas sp. sif2433 TaxID=2854794 RepID=UPI001C455B86|nr:2Fe-2S iron-sulfur cluster-binding protein [Aeromonas sp. sif2433]MBV7413504.1 2Fe-2S iron-sulfur cluster binding domain-containing protein [Aeromonas sp. sif2433]
MITVNMTINDRLIGPIEVDDNTMMIDFLHEYVNLTGTKFGCGVGVCHACTIVVDGADGSSESVRTCVNGVGRFNGQRIRTVEGHAKRNNLGKIIALSPVQKTFLDHFSFQCGWCTSGFVNETTVLLERLRKQPVAMADLESTIEGALKDHVCRCTGYKKYYEGVKAMLISEGVVRT